MNEPQVTVSGGQPHVDVLPGDVTGPIGNVKHDRARDRRLVAQRDDGADQPHHSFQYRCSRHGSP
ncbi:MAG TPA: hypothetical protein VGX96_12520 [Candidatus Elarobacter sp.]|jgi:hypothetical protein|nr:hypothetical protein [Candidatus Elarobacter sp.]